MKKLYNTKPYEYQRERILKSIGHMVNVGHNAYLMDMGTGKTISTIYTALNLFSKGLIEVLLVIPPKSLFSTWKDEIAKHIHSDVDLQVLYWDSKKAKNKSFIKSVSSFMLPFNGLKIVFANIELFQTKQEHFFKFIDGVQDTFKTMIAVDESGKIKNHKAQRTKNLIKHTREAGFRAILTGTEISNSVLDLYAQFEFLKTNYWNIPQKTLSQRFYIFQARYMMLKKMTLRRPTSGGGFKTVEFDKPVGVKPGRLQHLYDLIDPVSVRALKSDHLDIPDKIYQVVNIEATAEQKRVYTDLKQRMYSEYDDHLLTVTVKVALYTRFRQIAGGFMPESGTLLGNTNNKLNFIIDDSEDYSGKVAIWAAFIPEIDSLKDGLNKYYKGETALSFKGGQSNDERSEILHRFKNDESVKYLVISPKPGSHGLNLQFCSLVYYYSNDLSPDVRAQSEDRFHRNGQDNHPVYKDLINKDLPIDLKVLNTLKGKQALMSEFQNMGKKEFFDLL